MAGFLKKLEKGVNDLADRASKQVDKTVSEHRQSAVLDYFRSGNVIQLVSRSSGRSLQIMQLPTGQLVVDGLGPEGNFPHAVFTVINEGNNRVRLHNNNNFLAIINGTTVLVNGQGAETLFQLHQIQTFVCLESATERGRHIGILQDGMLKSALATGREENSHFGVRLIISKYPPPQAQGGQPYVVNKPL